MEVKEPSPMREARDLSPSPPPAPKLESDSIDPSSAEPLPSESADISIIKKEETPAPPSKRPRTRPLIDKSLLGAALGKVGKDVKDVKGRRAAKSIFGVVVGTLKKAELDDKKRSATEAAKKRAIIDSRLQSKIARETAAVRKQEENKRDKTGATRREEDLALKESLFNLRQKRGRLLGNYLRTDDDFLKDDDDDDTAVDQDRDRDEREREEAMDMDDGRSNSGRGSRPSSPPPDSNGNGAQDEHPTIGTREQLRRARDAEMKERQRRAKEKAKIDLLLAPARGHPSAIYYLPAILLPSQRRFLEKRKSSILDVLEKEEKIFTEERKKEVLEIRAIRQRVDEEEERLDAEKKELEAISSKGVVRDMDISSGRRAERSARRENGDADDGEEMDIEDEREEREVKREIEALKEDEDDRRDDEERNTDSNAMDEDRDDAVEY